MKAQDKKPKRGWAKPAYTLDVLDAGRYVWRGKGCRPAGVKHVTGLALVTGGHGQLKAGGFAGKLGRGDLVWLPPGAGVEVGLKGKAPVEALVMWFDLRGSGSDSGAGREAGVRRLSAGKFKAMARVFEALLDRWGEGPTIGSRVLVWAYAARLLGMAMEPAGRGARARDAGAPGQQLTHVLGFIETRLAGALDLVVLAKMAGLSRTHFAQWFRRRVGQSPMRYVRERRVERAKGLLRSTDLTVEEVAGRVGFDDPAHFNRVFRSVVGVPPLRYARGGWRGAGLD